MQAIWAWIKTGKVQPQIEIHVLNDDKVDEKYKVIMHE
jgi:hypothetical protein